MVSNEVSVESFIDSFEAQLIKIVESYESKIEDLEDEVARLEKELEEFTPSVTIDSVLASMKWMVSQIEGVVSEASKEIEEIEEELGDE